MNNTLGSMFCAMGNSEGRKVHAHACRNEASVHHNVTCPLRSSSTPIVPPRRQSLAEPLLEVHDEDLDELETDLALRRFFPTFFTDLSLQSAFTRRSVIPWCW